MIQLDKTGVVDICHAMVACDNQVYLKWVIKIQWKYISIHEFLPNNYLMGHIKSYYILPYI